MRSNLVFLIMLIAALTALPGTVIANLVYNPGFEDLDADNSPWDDTIYPDEWGGWNPGGTSTWLKTGGISGSAGLVLEATADAGQHVWPVGTGESIDIPVDDNQQDYYFAVYAKGGTELTFKIEWHSTDGETGEGGLPNVQEVITPTESWYQYQVGPLTPDPQANFVRFDLRNSSVGTSVTIDQAWVDIIPAPAPSPVHHPSPEDGETVVPGTYTLSWEHFGPDGCTIYWDNGSPDVNDLNFNKKFDQSDPAIVQIGLTDQEPNYIDSLSFDAEKGYYWRVDCGGIEGHVLSFTTVNDPPVVDAGPKQNLWLPDGGGTVTTQLAPTVTDDVLPDGEIDQYSWDAVAGVVFDPCESDGSSAAMAPTASMSSAGNYTLTLTVTDGTGGTAKSGDDIILLRVFNFADEGLLARYDCEETDVTWGIHDDYSGTVRNPLGVYPDFDYSNGTRRGERMNVPGSIPADLSKDATTLLLTGGHNGAIYGGDVDGTAGDGGIQFDGIAGHVYLANSDSDPNLNPWIDDPEDDPTWTPSWADLRDEVSVMAWIKVDTDNGGWDDEYEAIITKGFDSTLLGAYRLERNASGDGVSFACEVTAADGSVATVSANGTFPVNDKDPNGDPRWHHVAGTYDGAQVCVYVDGLADSCVEAEGTMPLADAPLTVGEAYDPTDLATNVPFGGVMDEIRIHSIGIPWRNAEPGAIDIVQIYRDSGGHTNCGGVYLPGDADENCFTDILDIKLMAEYWLDCSSIDRPNCDDFWR